MPPPAQTRSKKNMFSPRKETINLMFIDDINAKKTKPLAKKKPSPKKPKKSIIEEKSKLQYSYFILHFFTFASTKYFV